MTRRRLRSSILALGLCLACGALAGCDDGPTSDFPPPGLELLTPRVGGPAGGLASVLLRSDQPARVSIAVDEMSPRLGTGRSGRDATALRFTVPADLGSGTAVLSVTAVSEGGLSETLQMTVEGLGDVETQPLAGAYFDVAALPTRAVLAAPSGLAVAVRGWGEPNTDVISGEVQAIAPDEAEGAVLVSGANALISTYEVSLEGELHTGPEFSFADYDSSMPQPVTQVHALHVNGALVAAATSRGMSLMDRDALGDGGEVFCRTRSAMTATLKQAVFDPAMIAVAVTPRERVVAAAAYLNIYEPAESGDDGGCSPAMPGRGTSVIASPQGAAEPWAIVAATTTDSFVWLGRSELGLMRLPLEFQLTETNRYFLEAELLEIGADALPLPIVVDIAPGRGDQLWVALADAEGLRGGLARIDDASVDLWVDDASLAGTPRALDTAAAADEGGLEVWVLSAGSVAIFTAR